MCSRLRKLWLGVAVLFLAGNAHARDAAYEARLLQVILASPLSKLERAQHMLNRIANGSHPIAASTHHLVPEDATVRESAEAVVEMLAQNLAHRGEPNDVIKAKIEDMYPLAAVSDDRIVQLHNEAMARNEGGMFRARLRDVERSKLLVAMTLDTRGLKYRLFDFWFNHFNVQGMKVSLDLANYNRMLMNNTHGSFQNLLLAVAMHPAMMLFLDNAHSTRILPDGRGPNENYGREIMELHTLGVGPTAGVYNQSDIYNAALVLTGWGVRLVSSGDIRRDFMYRQQLHDMSEKTIMGIKYNPTGSGSLKGMNEGLDFIGRLAQHPRTARNIIKKLSRYFVTLDGEFTAPMQERMFQVWSITNGNLEEVYKEMFASPEFWSREAYLAKVKRPLDYVVSAAKYTGVSEDTLDYALIEKMKTTTAEMGQELFTYGDPTGYPDVNAYWMNSNAAINCARFGYWVADYRVAFRPKYQQYLEWERYISWLGGQFRVDTANQALNGLVDILGIDHRYNASESLRRGNVDGFFNASFHRPDLKSGEPRPLRTAIGIILGGKDFLKH